MRYTTLGDGDRAFDVSTLALGTMLHGTAVDEETSFAILDRYVAAGGTFLDTANNYSLWAGGHGRDSEDVLGRWLASRDARDEVRLATKLGAAQKDRSKPLSSTPPTNYQGLGADVIRREAQESLRHLGVEKIDLLYGHVDDLDTPLAETVGAFGKLQAEGVVGLTGISNVATWRVVEARAEAERQGVPGYSVVQENFSYIYPPPVPSRQDWANADLLDYAASTGVDGRPRLSVVAYSPVHQGAFARDDKPLYGGTDRPGSRARIAELRQVAHELGATPSQVALAWLLGGDWPVVPLIGPSSVAQLDELLDAAELDLSADVRERLDAA
jgi:aryl-alcohol dehydrogenase-like predicted oxidoreductase